MPKQESGLWRKGRAAAFNRLSSLRLKLGQEQHRHAGAGKNRGARIPDHSSGEGAVGVRDEQQCHRRKVLSTDRYRMDPTGPHRSQTGDVCSKRITT